MFGRIFCYLHPKIGNLLQKLWKYHSLQGVKSLDFGNVWKYGWGRMFTCQGIFGLFLQNIYPYRATELETITTLESISQIWLSSSKRRSNLAKRNVSYGILVIRLKLRSRMLSSGLAWLWKVPLLNSEISLFCRDKI